MILMKHDEYKMILSQIDNRVCVEMRIVGKRNELLSVVMQETTYSAIKMHFFDKKVPKLLLRTDH